MRTNKTGDAAATGRRVVPAALAVTSAGGTWSRAAERRVPDRRPLSKLADRLNTPLAIHLRRLVQ